MQKIRIELDESNIGAVRRRRTGFGIQIKEEVGITMQVSLSRLRSAGFNTIFRDEFLYLYHHAEGVCLRLRPDNDTIIHPTWDKIVPPADFFAISAL